MALDDAEHHSEFAAHTATRISDPKNPNAWHLALVEIRDPAKLAELYVLALRPRGFVNSKHLRISYYVHPITTAPMIGIWWPRHCENADCDMPTARARLAAIMKTDPVESSFATCDLILKGEP
jgi:hypothetical protein